MKKKCCVLFVLTIVLSSIFTATSVYAFSFGDLIPSTGLFSIGDVVSWLQDFLRITGYVIGTCNYNSDCCDGFAGRRVICMNGVCDLAAIGTGYLCPSDTTSTTSTTTTTTTTTTTIPDCSYNSDCCDGFAGRRVICMNGVCDLAAIGTGYLCPSDTTTTTTTTTLPATCECSVDANCDNWCSRTQSCQRYYKNTCDGCSCTGNYAYATDDTCTNMCVDGDVCSDGICVSAGVDTTPDTTPDCSYNSDCCDGFAGRRVICMSGVCDLAAIGTGYLCPSDTTSTSSTSSTSSTTTTIVSTDVCCCLYECSEDEICIYSDSCTGNYQECDNSACVTTTADDTTTDDTTSTDDTATTDDDTTTIPITSNLPDMTIESVWSEENKIHYRVKNQGGSYSIGTYVPLIIDDSYIGTDFVNAMSPQHIRDKQFVFYTWECSGTTDDIKVCVDTEVLGIGFIHVEESNENNNCKKVTLSCETGEIVEPVEEDGGDDIEQTATCSSPNTCVPECIEGRKLEGVCEERGYCCAPEDEQIVWCESPNTCKESCDSYGVDGECSSGTCCMEWCSSPNVCAGTCPRIGIVNDYYCYHGDCCPIDLASDYFVIGDPTCNDNDLGVFITISSTCTDSEAEYRDVCSDETTVDEYVCTSTAGEDDTCSAVATRCETGYVCKNGACTQSNACEDYPNQYCKEECGRVDLDGAGSCSSGNVCCLERPPHPSLVNM